MLLKSKMNREAIAVLSEGYPYFEGLENAMKIRKYARSRNLYRLFESTAEDKYRHLINQHIISELGYLSLDDITIEKINSFII